jgi:hypothetical protein
LCLRHKPLIRHCSFGTVTTMSHSTVSLYKPCQRLCQLTHIAVPYQRTVDIEKAFVRDGVLPPGENSTFITIYEPGMARGPISSPYDVPTGFAAGDIDSA